MADLNKPICATEYGNTGLGDCYIELDKIVGAIQVPSNFQISQSDVSGLLDFLETKTYAAIGTRIFPYPKLINITDNSEDITINTTEYGDKIFVKDGFYDWTFRYLKGGVQLHQELAKNQGSGKYFLFFDKNNVLIGYKSGSVLKGVPVDQFRVLPWRPNTGAESALFNLRFIIDPIYLNQGNLGFLKVTDFNLLDVVGLQEVELTIIDQAANVATVKVTSKIGGVDLYGAYKTNLLQITAWKGFKSDGSASSISSVSDNVADEAFDVALNAGDVINELDGARMKIQLAAAHILNAAPILISGFDDSDGVPFYVESASS